jgi:hypothetical protein
MQPEMALLPKDLPAVQRLTTLKSLAAHRQRQRQGRNLLQPSHLCVPLPLDQCRGLRLHSLHMVLMDSLHLRVISSILSRALPDLLNNILQEEQRAAGDPLCGRVLRPVSILGMPPLCPERRPLTYPTDHLHTVRTLTAMTNHVSHTHRTLRDARLHTPQTDLLGMLLRPNRGLEYQLVNLKSIHVSAEVSTQGTVPQKIRSQTTILPVQASNVLRMFRMMT